MGLFDFMKKKATVKQPQTTKAATKPSRECLDKLTKDGELPWGWIYQHKDFTDKINGEYTHFLNTWLDSGNKSPKEQYQALKSFVLYLKDAEKLCKSKGECYEFWFYEILATKDYIEKRTSELEELSANLERGDATTNHRNKDKNKRSESIGKN